jgi:hypothetical protein
MSEQPQSPFRCSVHDYSPDGSKPLGEQEDEYYQHLRDEEHTYSVSKPCQNCSKNVTKSAVTGKVPQPTPDVKNPRSVIVFCNDDCQKEYLKKLGVSA